MTLLEMADYVCLKVKHTDATAKATAKDFLKRRYEMIWHDQLWMDTLVMVDVSVTKSTDTLHAAGYVLMPTIIAEVVGVRRTDDQSLSPETYESFFRYSHDFFTNSGDPVAYIQLGPVVWQFSGATTVRVIQDVDKTDDQTDVYLRLQKGDNTITEFNAKVNWGAYKTVTNVLVIESINKKATNQDILITDITETTTYVTVPAADTNAKKRQRIRLIEKPNADITLRVLGKRRFLNMTRDNDSPTLEKASNAILTYAQGDMLEWTRQYGKASQKFIEANALLEQLKQTEVFQRAYSPRLIPDGVGSETDYDFWTKKDYV